MKFIMNNFNTLKEQNNDIIKMIKKEKKLKAENNMHLEKQLTEFLRVNKEEMESLKIKEKEFR